MNGLSLIRLAIIQQGRVQKSCLNRWLSLWFGVYLLRLSHLAISWKPPSWKDRHTDTGAWSNSWNSPLCIPRCVHLLQSHWTNIKLLLQKSREDQDTRMRGRTVIHVPHSRTIINDHKFELMGPQGQIYANTLILVNMQCLQFVGPSILFTTLLTKTYGMCKGASKQTLDLRILPRLDPPPPAVLKFLDPPLVPYNLYWVQWYLSVIYFVWI